MPDFWKGSEYLIEIFNFLGGGMYRKIWFFGVLTLFLNAEVSGSTYIESKMGCKILHQSIVENDAAKIGTFVGYKDNLSVGDTFFLRYSFIEKSEKISVFQLELSKSPSFKGGLETVGDPFVFTYDISFENSTLISGGGGNTYAYYLTNDDGYGLTQAFQFRLNSLKANYTFDIGGIVLSRYFGNDFIGTYTSTSKLVNKPIVTHVYSFSCQHLTESYWDKILKILNAP